MLEDNAYMGVQDAGVREEAKQAILRWLAFIPCTTTSIPRVLMSRDSINREVLETFPAESRTTYYSSDSVDAAA